MTFEEALWVGSDALRGMACPADALVHSVPSGFKPPDTSGSSCCSWLLRSCCCKRSRGKPHVWQRSIYMCILHGAKAS